MPHAIEQSVFTIGKCCLVGGEIVSVSCCNGQCDCPKYKKFEVFLDAENSNTYPQAIVGAGISITKETDSSPTEQFELSFAPQETIESAMVGSWTRDVILNGEVIGTLEFETTNTQTGIVAVVFGVAYLKLTIFGNCVYEVENGDLMRYPATGLQVIGYVKTN